MASKKTLVLSVPSDVREWIVKEAGQRRMTISDYALRLLTLGIQSETIDIGVAKLAAAVEAGGITRVMLREVLATRYIVEAQAKGAVKVAATLGTDANTYADKELEKIWPKGEEQ